LARNYFLDRDIIVDKLNNVYTILTNYNPPGYIFAYLKYVYTGSGLWKGYDRVLKQYGIHNLVKLEQKFNFESCYDASFPIVYLSEIRTHLKPEEKLNHLLKHSASDDLIYYLIDFIENYVRVSNLGVTGSLLLGNYHKNSDIDLVIYGCKNSLDFIESFKGFEIDKEWIIEANNNYNIDFADKLYDNKRRGIYKGRRVSILFVDDKPWRYCERICRKLGRVRFKGLISGDCKALFYPAVATVQSSNEYQISTIINYEGVFSSALLGDREVIVEGMLMKCEEENVVIVGDREVRGYIKPMQ
jgi:hypothetical protein